MLLELNRTTLQAPTHSSRQLKRAIRSAAGTAVARRRQVRGRLRTAQGIRLGSQHTASPPTFALAQFAGFADHCQRVFARAGCRESGTSACRKQIRRRRGETSLQLSIRRQYKNAQKQRHGPHVYDVVLTNPECPGWIAIRRARFGTAHQWTEAPKSMMQGSGLSGFLGCWSRRQILCGLSSR